MESLRVGPPQDFLVSILEKVSKLIQKCGEVEPAGLMQRLKNAHLLACIWIGEEIVAVGAPRQYLYLELNAENRNTGLVAWVKLKTQPQWYSSHRGRLDFTASRSGWFRTTVELPPGTTIESIEYLTIECLDLRDPRNPGRGPQPESLLREVGQAFLLDVDYRPG